MKIGIDYRLAVNSHRGMGRYIREILNELLKIDTENQYFLYVDKGIDLEMNNKNVIIKKIKSLNYIYFEQIILPIEAKKDKLDILWSPANTFPIFLYKKIKLFTTIHDLIFMDENIEKSNNFYQKIGRIYRKFIVKNFSKKINICFTVSEFSKQEIKNRLNIDSILTYNKIDNFYRLIKGKKQETDILKRLNLAQGSYFFTVSGDAPSKNLETLIRLFSRKNINEKLVITGGVSEKNKKNILKLGLQESLIFTDFINDFELIDLYKNSKAFIFLSLAEGFGIPVLEAMFFSLLIVASDRTSIPEILGDGGIKVNPLDIEKIENILVNLEKFDIAKYKEFQKKQVLKFLNWKDTAEVVYKEIERI